MVESVNSSIVKKFFNEIYEKVKQSNIDVTELWCEISEINALHSFNHYEVRDFLSYLDSISIKKGNYMPYIVINKIKFMTECLRFMDNDIKSLAELLDFGGFEALIQEILVQNNYRAIKNYRFTDKSNFKSETSQKRYEIDIIAIQQNYILLIDAKQWRRKDSYSAMNKAADLQFRRALALKNNPEIFSNLIQNLMSSNLKMRIKFPFILIPLTVSLESNWIKINDNSIPLVSIQNLNSFLQELRFNLEYFKTIEVNRIGIQKQLF